MPYCTKDQVADEFVNVTFTSTTKVTDVQVDAWIARADALIDAMVGLRYVTPVTGANSLLVLEEISVDCVAWRVAKKLRVKTPKTEPNQGMPPLDRKALALKKLDAIVKGKMDLADAVLVDDSDGVRSFNADNNVENFFKREVDQW